MVAVQVGTSARVATRTSTDQVKQNPRPPVMVVVALDRVVDDIDDQDQVQAAIGYAWAIHGDRGRTGAFEDLPQGWSAPDKFWFDTPFGHRRNPSVAAAAFLRDAIRFVAEGSPPRQDGTRLVEPQRIPIAVSDTYALI